MQPHDPFNGLSQAQHFIANELDLDLDQYLTLMHSMMMAVQSCRVYHSQDGQMLIV